MEIALSTAIATISHKIVKIVFMQEMLIVSIAVVMRYRIIVTTEIADRIIAMLHNVFKIIVTAIVHVIVLVLLVAIVLVAVVVANNNIMKRNI
jgi:hypothetical protein